MPGGARRAALADDAGQRPLQDHRPRPAARGAPDGGLRLRGAGAGPPGAPGFGVTEPPGAGATTVKPPASVPPLPPAFATVRLRVPGAALLAVVSVAVSCAADPTLTSLDVTPVPLTLTVAPAANPLPLIVTGTAVPGAP